MVDDDVGFISEVTPYKYILYVDLSYNVTNFLSTWCMSNY